MEASKEVFFRILAEDREDNKWDFKQDIHLKPVAHFYELLKDILAFSNSGGGHLLLGVEDKTHKLIGVSDTIDEADLGQKIKTALGYPINFQIKYFKYTEEGKDIESNLGIMYIPNSFRILTSAKTFTGSKSTVIQADTVYVRRNTSSINANGEDLETLAYKVLKKGTYQYSEADKEIIERNKQFAQNRGDVYSFLEDEYKFSTLNFSYKLNDIYQSQVEFGKLEFAMLLGLDEDKIDDYFNGYAMPKLEHLLRATEIFKLPKDYFFHPTIANRKPLWHNPMISHCIIEKVDKKNNLFSIDYGKFFREVLLTLGRTLYMFKRWLNSPRQVKPTDEVELMFSNYDELNDYVVDLTDEQLSDYKKHLAVQFYKLLEQIDLSDFNRSNLMEEEFIIRIIGSNDEYICRIINEAIKEIKVTNDNEIDIEFHYLYELKNLVVRGRGYNTEEVKVDLTEERRIKIPN